MKKSTTNSSHFCSAVKKRMSRLAVAVTAFPIQVLKNVVEARQRFF
jgi:hypothetical protein